MKISLNKGNKRFLRVMILNVFYLLGIISCSHSYGPDVKIKIPVVLHYAGFELQDGTRITHKPGYASDNTLGVMNVFERSGKLILQEDTIIQIPNEKNEFYIDVIELPSMGYFQSNTGNTVVVVFDMSLAYPNKQFFVLQRKSDNGEWTVFEIDISWLSHNYRTAASGEPPAYWVQKISDKKIVFNDGEIVVSIDQLEANPRANQE